MSKRKPFDGPIVGSWESNALRLLLKLAETRAAMRKAAGKPAFLAAVTDEWEILSEIDGFASHVNNARAQEERG